MKKSVQAVFLILCIFACLKDSSSKNLFIHAVEYNLSEQKVLSMATVNLFNEVLPAFIMLEPQVQVFAQKQITENDQLASYFTEVKGKTEFQKQRKKQQISNFHSKLPVPIKVIIQNSDLTEQQCLFDEPWDLCLIQKPKKSLDFSIHCLLQQSEDKKLFCKGKAIIRQADLTRIPYSDSTYQQKIKYESGLFSIPQLDKHSVMLISCQDDDLPEFTESLKIFSTLKYHRYERQDGDQVKDFIGFDKSSFINKKQQIDPSIPIANQPLINDIGMQTVNTADFIDKTKSQLLQTDVNFVYLDVEQQLVRKCLQFQFYGTNQIVNERQVFDYLNLTDNGYKNVYDIVRKDQSVGKNQQKFTEVITVVEPLFKYNLQFTLNVFKPQHFFINEAYDIRIKLLDKTKKSTILSYTIPFALSNESAQHTTSLYSRSNHYHFTYVVGGLLIKQLKQLQIQVQFEARSLDKSKPVQSGQKNNFFFISLSVQDVQHVVVEKLMHSYLSIKKGDHITFLIQEPYQVDDITTAQNTKSNDLIEVKPSSQHLQVKLSQHLTDHEHKNQCHYSKGCKFQIDATNDCLDCRIQYKSSFIRKNDDILIIEMKNQVFQGKIDLDETQYFYKQLKPTQVIQFIISTPNIIVFTLQNQKDIQRCKIPKKSCHTQIATSHEKIILQNPSKENPQIFYFAVQGLDKTRFTIILLASNNVVNVMNGMPFTYKLPQNKEDIELMFEVPQFEQGKPYKNNVTFNLVAPLNSLEMDIIQLKQDGTQLEAIEKTKTMAGFVKISAKQVKSKKIKVILTKTTSSMGHAVHFTFIPSTSDHKFRLDTGITHYQVFDAGEQKNFVIQFEDTHTYEISMHFYDSQNADILFSVLIFNPNEGGNSKGLNYKITSTDFTLILDDDLIDKNDLCPENDPQCSLFIMVNSLMTHEAEVSMTLLTADSVMQLKDGVWQTFNVDDLLVNTHFYFVPTHEDNPVKIFFKSTDPNIYLTASLYDNRQNVNPAEWPFPQTHGHDQQDFQYNQNYMFKSNHLIQVDNEDAEFKKCFPHCVVLMSIYQVKPSPQDKKAVQLADKQPQKQSFSILASNNQIQLPQKIRLQLQLKQGQQQFIFVNLKHAFKQKKEMFTFFTNTKIGYANIYAKIYIPSLQNIPDKQDYEILFEPLRTQIKMQQIRDNFDKNEAWMEGVDSIEEILQRQELYLALLIDAQQDTQLSLQYTTDYSQIKELQLDSVETVVLQENEQKLFQYVPTRDQKVRFIRTKGYPLFHQFKCQGDGNYNNCLKLWLQKLRLTTENDIRTIKKQLSVENQLTESPLLTDQKMKQIAQLSEQQHFSQYQVLKRTQTQHVIECQRCIVFIWIYALQQSQLSIQLQSLNTETLLKQNQLLTDYIEPNEFHRYYMPRVQKQYSTIIITVNQGNPIIIVSDNFNYQQTKKGSQIKQKGRKVILFNVPPLKQKPKKQNQQDQITKTSSFNKIFSNLHVSITTEDIKPVSYSITYSSGRHQMELKNGIISTQFLFENQKAVFYYKNQDKNAKSYLTLTVESQPQQIQKILQGIEIKMYSLTMQKQTNLLIRNQLLSQKPLSASKSLKKQTTLTYQIPPFDDLQINILTKITTKITIGINNGKIIFLPLSYEYPVFLKPKQDIRFVIQNLQQGHIQFVVKKCDQSNPYIFYTNDQTQFQKDLFSNYDRFGSQNVYRHVSRIKDKGSLYLKIKADPKQNSLLLISANYAMTPGDNFVDLDPGNSGVIGYQFESLKQVKLNFTGLECGKDCQQLIEYYLVRSKSLPKIYNELVCAGQQMIKLFQKQSSSKTQQKQSKSLLDPIASEIKIQRILSQLSKDESHFQFVVPADELYPYVTIKAVYIPTGEQVYYKPIELKSFKGSVSNYSPQLLLTFIGALLLGLAILVLVTQKLSRKGYVHIGSEQTMIV